MQRRMCCGPKSRERGAGGNRVCSRKGEHDILSLKRELEELNMASIEEMKAHVKRARPRPVARPLLQERGVPGRVLVCANRVAVKLDAILVPL